MAIGKRIGSIFWGTLAAALAFRNYRNRPEGTTTVLEPEVETPQHHQPSTNDISADTDRVDIVEPKSKAARTQQPRYEAYIAPSGRLAVKFPDDNFVLASVSDQPFFRRERFANYPGSLDVIVAAEDIAQQTMKASGPRINSGAPGTDHLRRVLQKLTEYAVSAGVKLDLRTTLGGIFHDEIELRVEKAEKLWQKYNVLAYIENDPKLRRMYEVLRDFSERVIEKMRLSIKGDIEDRLIRVIPKDVRNFGRLKGDIEKGTYQALRLTRFNRFIYPESMEYQFTRFHNESLDLTFGRSPIKFADLGANMEETHPLTVLEQLALAYTDQRMMGKYVIGQELAERFGKINANATSMSPSNMVLTASRSVFPFHYFNENVDRYGQQASTSDDVSIRKHYKLAMHSRDRTIVTAENLARKAIEEFEERPEIKEIIPIVDRYIDTRMRGDFFNRITWPGGVIVPLMEYDVRGREFVDNLDKEVGDLDGHGMRFMYKAARVLQVLIPRFKLYADRVAKSGRSLVYKMNDTSLFDPTKHKPFPLGGMDEIMKLKQNYRELFAEAKSPNNGK